MAKHAGGLEITPAIDGHRRLEHFPREAMDRQKGENVHG
jgi:hypothetical protein